MAEVNLHFGSDGHVIVPVSAAFSRLDLSDGDFIVCTIPPAVRVIDMGPVAEQLRDMLDERGFKHVRVILLAEGTTVTKLSVEELRSLGLQPIP